MPGARQRNRSVTAPPRAGHDAVPLRNAVAGFLDRYRDEKGTRVTYTETLAHLLAAAGDTARLLPRLLAGRIAGPVFLADRRSPASGKRARALADIDPLSGRGRLSYPRAEYLFKQASALHDPHGTGWTLHKLRHSALRHLAASGRSAPELQATSRHKHLATLAHYVRLGEETSARITADNDPLARRRAL